MEDSSLKRVLATPEEPHRKKFKIDSNQVIFEKEQQQLFEMCSEDKKSANNFLCFPKILWNFRQHNLELREKSSTNLKTSVRQHANFKMYMNANLQSRLLENIPYIEKWPPNSCTRNGSCKLKKNNPDFIKLESLVSYAKESGTATKTANTSKTNEWPTKDIIFYIVLAETLIARIESLFGDVAEFQNKEKDSRCCHVCEILQSEEQHLTSKPVRSDENSDKEVLKFCLQFKYFMNGKKSDFESLNYQYKNILHKNNYILSYKKQKRFSGKKNFRRNKIFRHTYTLYSKKCGINLKLTRCIAFELFLQSKGTYCYSTVTENDIPVLNQINKINHQQTEESNEEETKECLLYPTDIREDDIFSMLYYGKNQTSQIIFSNNQNIQSKKFNILWKRIFPYIPETIYNLTDIFRLLNYLVLIPIMLKKSKAKSFKLEIVTVEPFIKKKNRKMCIQTNDFSSKRIKHSYFVLKAHNKWEKRIIINSINCTNNKYVPKYIVTGCTERMNKMQYNDYKHNQNNPSYFVDRKSHLDTYKKISLSSYSEDIEHISVLGDAIITDKKSSKRCITADKGFTRSHSETLTYICAPLKLCANDSCLLKQGSKSKTSQYFEDRQWLKHKINTIFFPISKRLLKQSLHVNQHFTPNTFDNLCLTQNMVISVEIKQSKTSLYGKKAKPRYFGFKKLKIVLQYQYQTMWISNVFKAPKAKAIENMNFLDSNNILFSCTIMSEILCINQTAENVNKTKCAIAKKNYVNKRNQSQNLCELYFKEECTKSVHSVGNLTASTSTKQKGVEDLRERHFSSETNRRDQFELVLEELRMFNEISKENEKNLSQTEINIIEKESHVLNCSDNILDQVNRNINPVISTTDITMSCTSGVKQNSYKKSLFKQNIQVGEQEISHNYSSNLADEELLGSSSEKCAHYKQSLSWKPAFVSQTFTTEGSSNLTTERGNCLLSGIIRIQPLKTCCRPLRVGLSRKAKLKQLHPYLK